MRASIVVGIDRTSYAGRGKLYNWLSLLDIGFSCLIVAPLVVAFWSSTWSAIKLLTNRTYFDIISPIAFGFSVIIFFTICQKQIKVLFTEDVENNFLYLLGSRLYTEIFGIACVSSWYGIWTVLDSIAGAKLRITLPIVLCSYVGLCCLKTVKNVISSPFAIIADNKRGYFDAPTLFQWFFDLKESKFLYLLDSVFSVFVIGTLVILVWRGMWCILDRLIFPQNLERSGWTSLTIGYAIVSIIFASQSCMNKIICNNRSWKKFVILDVYMLMSFCGTINIWRGIWMLLEIYAYLAESLKNCFLLHFGSFFALVLLNASNTLLVRGVYIDAEESEDDCVNFPCYYFRLMFQNKQREKACIELNKTQTENAEKDAISSNVNDENQHPQSSSDTFNQRESTEIPVCLPLSSSSSINS